MLAGGVVKGVAPPVQRGPGLEAEQSADVVVALDPQKTGGAAQVADPVIVQQLAKRRAGPGDGVLPIQS